MATSAAVGIPHRTRISHSALQGLPQGVFYGSHLGDKTGPTGVAVRPHPFIPQYNPMIGRGPTHYTERRYPVNKVYPR